MSLANGLTIITEEQHHAPVVSFWAAYKVGSRNERAGRTGISHWLEHMLFKPTEQFPGAERDRLISREGGITNAYTWVDGTSYFSTIPSSEADLVYRIEADRMANSVIDPELFDTERTVILAERFASENEPDWRLSEKVTAAAFRKHPYQYEIVGSEEDLRAITAEQMFAHYKTYCVPNNAVLVAVGDFETEKLVRRLGQLFGEIPGGAEPPEVRVKEPPIEPDQRIILEGTGGSGYLSAVYHGPAATDLDFVPVMLLCGILNGPQNLSMSSGTSRSSRLYRALVETGLAVDVDCSIQPSIDPYLIDLSALLWTGRTHEELEAAIDRVIDGITSAPVSNEELARAKKQTISRHVFANERITGRAMMLAFGGIVFGLPLLEDFAAKVESVTAEDVLRVARTYLGGKNRVTGWYVATDGDEEDEE